MITAKWFLLLGAVNGVLAVTLGAFGAHGLKGSLTASALTTWQTAVQYQFYHVFALLMVAMFLLHQLSGFWLTLAGICFALGIALFCGSLYWLALGGPRWLGPITPLGGLLFIIGWCALCATAFKAN